MVNFDFDFFYCIYTEPIIAVSVDMSLDMEGAETAGRLSKSGTTAPYYAVVPTLGRETTEFTGTIFKVFRGDRLITFSPISARQTDAKIPTIITSIYCFAMNFDCCHM